LFAAIRSSAVFNADDRCVCLENDNDPITPGHCGHFSQATGLLNSSRQQDERLYPGPRPTLTVAFRDESRFSDWAIGPCSIDPFQAIMGHLLTLGFGAAGPASVLLVSGGSAEVIREAPHCLHL
jgi:hypothetical protein